MNDIMIKDSNPNLHNKNLVHRINTGLQQFIEICKQFKANAMNDLISWVMTGLE